MSGRQKRYFCPSCKKFVEDVSSRFGTQVGPSWMAPAGELPVFVCGRCESPVMELTESDGKTRVL